MAACEMYKNVYVQTPWPQLYWDLPVKCVKVNSHLRTQRANVAKQSGWFYPTHNATKKELNYNVRGFMENVSVLEQFNRIQEINAFELTFPVKDEWAFDVPDKFAVVHYPTLRKEWLNSARNCKVEYIQQCVDWLKREGYTIISIAHIKDGQEWFVQEPSGCDIEFHHGEISIEQVAWLLSRSEIAISPVGFVLPLGWAVGCKTFIIYGGSTGPRILSDDRFKQDNLCNVLPEPFCECHRKEHSCNKEVEHLEEKLFSFLEGKK
jgi:ADP-heptose:LPS heptosyltransferase